MSIKKAWCPQCRAPLFEALTDQGRKIMLDWEPFFGRITEDGIYFLVHGATSSVTVKHYQLTDEWPEYHTPWSAHACARSKR